MGEVISGIFMMIFGIVFASFPIGMGLTIISFGNDMSLMFPFMVLGIFVIAGISITIYGFSTILKYFKKKKIKKIGTPTTAKFVRMGSNVSNNAARYYYIVFTYTDKNGNEVEYKTKNEYKYEEANYFATLGKFAIKYSGKTAVIVEEIDYHKMEQLNPESNKHGIFNTLLNSLTGKQEEPKPVEYYYICDYCANTQDKHGKCKCCGAKIDPANKRVKH